jgi:hypothetical protein
LRGLRRKIGKNGSDLGEKMGSLGGGRGGEKEEEEKEEVWGKRRE